MKRSIHEGIPECRSSESSSYRCECREFAEKWIDVHKDQFKRLGVVGDWENYYSTMSYEAEAQIVRELGKFLKEGSLYRGFKPVLWSTVEKTALADAEVEYLDHTSNTIYVAFKIKDPSKDFLKDASIIIWTTTPWTIPANKALAYNRSLKYMLSLQVLCERYNLPYKQFQMIDPFNDYITGL